MSSSRSLLHHSSANSRQCRALARRPPILEVRGDFTDAAPARLRAARAAPLPDRAGADRCCGCAQAVPAAVLARVPGADWRPGGRCYRGGLVSVPRFGPANQSIPRPVGFLPKSPMARTCNADVAARVDEMARLELAGKRRVLRRPVAILLRAWTSAWVAQRRTWHLPAVPDAAGRAPRLATCAQGFWRRYAGTLQRQLASLPEPYRRGPWRGPSWRDRAGSPAPSRAPWVEGELRGFA